MYLVIRRVNGREITIAKLKNKKAAGIVRDAARYRRPHWDVGVVFTDNPDAYPNTTPKDLTFAELN